ncbi:MAG TPA: hypothetical protein VLA21_07245, partial [Candidatus Limnocylindria bacterium]|nr:hypothetical protein [Candidatus Limnocylindria bacterium]
MSQAERLESMTVLELRKFSRDNHLPLSTATTKAGIIDIISAALREREGGQAAGENRPAEHRRAATIIADEGDEPAPAAAAPAPRPQPDRTRTSTGKPKPVFTLQGSRAWHNPQPFQAQTPGRAPAPGGFGGAMRDSAADSMRYQPQGQRPPVNRPARFGPATLPPPDIDAQDGAIPEPRPYPYAPPQQARPTPYQTGAYRSVLPAAPSGITEASAMPEVSLPELEMQLAEPVRDRVNPAVPEMLAAGDVGEGAGV